MILTEIYGSLQQDHAKKAALFLNEYCSEFIKKSDFNLFYRGMNTLTNAIYRDVLYEEPIRQDRKSLHSSAPLTDAIDAYFIDKVGYPLRKRCVFATRNKQEVHHYGSNVGAIFLPDGFSYAWSEDIYDLTSEFQINFDASHRILIKAKQHGIEYPYSGSDNAKKNALTDIFKTVDPYLINEGLNKVDFQEVSFVANKYYFVPLTALPTVLNHLYKL